MKLCACGSNPLTTTLAWFMSQTRFSEFFSKPVAPACFHHQTFHFLASIRLFAPIRCHHTTHCANGIRRLPKRTPAIFRFSFIFVANLQMTHDYPKGRRLKRYYSQKFLNTRWQKQSRECWTWSPSKHPPKQEHKPVQPTRRVKRPQSRETIPTTGAGQ